MTFTEGYRGGGKIPQNVLIFQIIRYKDVKYISSADLSRLYSISEI